jgi:hypothetical protein
MPAPTSISIGIKVSAVQQSGGNKDRGIDWEQKKRHREIKQDSKQFRQTDSGMEHPVGRRFERADRPIGRAERHFV